MGDLLETFRGFDFLLHALVAGLCIAATASLFGVFVVQRRMAFLASGLGHAAFGGVAVGIFAGLTDPTWLGIPYTVGAALAIQWLRRHTPLSADTIIGILLSVSMAVGIVLLSLTPRFSTDAMSYLFGSILFVRESDAWLAGCLLAATVALLWGGGLWGRWAYATFDGELARADRLPVSRDDDLLAASIALAVILAVKIVGVVLVGAFAILPAATARLVAARFTTMTVLSVVFGCASVLGGLVLSVQLDWPSGATIILIQSLLFALIFTIGLVTRRFTLA